MQLQHAALRICWRSFAASVTIAVISVAVAVAVIIVIIDIAAPAATAAVPHRVCVSCCRQLYYRRRKLEFTWSSPSAAAAAAAAAAALACNRVLCMAGPWPETALTVKRQRCAATPQRRVCSC